MSFTELCLAAIALEGLFLLFMLDDAMMVIEKWAQAIYDRLEGDEEK